MWALTLSTKQRYTQTGTHSQLHIYSHAQSHTITLVFVCTHTHTQTHLKQLKLKKLPLEYHRSLFGNLSQKDPGWEKRNDPTSEAPIMAIGRLTSWRKALDDLLGFGFPEPWRAFEPCGK